MIVSIRLVNWRSHHDATLTFHKGTNLLMGEMGSGKSSVLDAICFALFGTFPALERRRLKLADVMRTGQEQASVALEFRWKGTMYRAERTLEKKRSIASDARVFRDGQLMDAGAVAVTQYVEQLLHVDYDLFTRAIYSEQNNIDYFLNLDPRKRKQEIDGLLGLDAFETVRANAVSVLNRIRSQRKDYEGRLNREQMETVAQKRMQTRKEEETATQRLAEWKERQAKHAPRMEAADKEFLHMRKQKELYDREREAYARLESKYEHLHQETQQVDKAAWEAAQGSYAALEKRWVAEQAKKQESEERGDAVNRQRAQAEAEWNEMERAWMKYQEAETAYTTIRKAKSIAEWQREVQEAEQQRLTLRAQMESLHEEQQRLQESTHLLRPGLANCPLCMQPLTTEGMAHVQKEKEKRVRWLGEELQRKTLEEKRAAVQWEEAQRTWKELERLAEIRKDGEALKKKRPLAAQKQQTVQKEWEELRTAQAALEKGMEELRKQREQMAWKARELERQWKQKQEAEKLRIELQERKKRLEQMEVREAQWEAVRKTVEEERLAGERIALEQRNAENEVRRLREMRALLEQEYGRMQELHEEIGWLAKLEDEVGAYSDAVVETQTGLRNAVTGAINAAVNDIWRIVYPYRNYSELRLQATEKDYVFEVYDTEWKTLETVASGGERSCAALALRVALAMVLTPNLSWLMLDEPTHNLDKQAVELLSQTLQFRVPEVVEQAFVISHEEALMGSDFACSYRLKRNKETGGPTEIEKI